MTASSLDLDLTTLTIHTAPTVDLTPPIRARTTTLGYESCDRRPLRSPVPDPDNCSPDDLLDYCANCRTHVDMRYDMTDDLKLALITLVERQAVKLDSRDDEILALTRQLAVLQGTSATLEAAFQRSDKALAATTVELYEERVLRVAALQDLETMRAVAIARGQERDEMMKAVTP